MMPHSMCACTGNPNHPFKDIILNALREAGYSNPQLCKTWGVIVDEVLRDKYGWPLLWEVLNEIDFSWGCGGTYYHQISEYPVKALTVMKALGLKEDASK